jgi:hypothetical protein
VGAVLRTVIETVICALLAWAVIYWWFVPDAMRLAIPAAHPSTGWKISLTVAALAYIFWCSMLAERLAAAIPDRLRQILYRLLRIGAGLADLTAFAALLRLFSPILGFAGPQPREVLYIFLIFAAGSWMRLLRKGFGLHAKIPHKPGHKNPFAGRTAHDLMKADIRPPILYLRSFDKELDRASTFGRMSYVRNPRGFYVASRKTDVTALLRRDMTRSLLGSGRSSFDEQMIFAEYFSAFGPYIAIGRPGETFENMDLGAAKLYVEDERWQETVLELLEISAAIVLEAGDSAGLGWELQQVVARARPRRLLLILPRRKQDYDEFRRFAASILPRSLPIASPESRLLTFADDWRPVPLDNPSLLLEDALEPFSSRLNMGAAKARPLRVAANNP